MPNLSFTTTTSPLRDQAAVDQHVHRLAGQPVELDHRALRELQQIADRDLGAAELDRELHRNVQHHVETPASRPHRALPGASSGNARACAADFWPSPSCSAIAAAQSSALKIVLDVIRHPRLHRVCWSSTFSTFSAYWPFITP